MNQQEYAIKAKPFIDALAEGKKIQYSSVYDLNPVWMDYAKTTFNFDQCNYRIVIPYIIVNGHEVPKPIDYQLNLGDEYYIPEFQCETGVLFCVWHNREIDNMRLKHGVIHLTYDDAQKHFKALVDYTLVG